MEARFGARAQAVRGDWRNYGDTCNNARLSSVGRHGKSRPHISKIGVDSRYRGKGFGGDLLSDCLIRLARVAEDMGTAIVMLDILDCCRPELVEKRKALYRSYGFQALPSNALRMFLPTATVRALTSGI